MTCLVSHGVLLCNIQTTISLFKCEVCKNNFMNMRSIFMGVNASKNAYLPAMPVTGKYKN